MSDLEDSVDIFQEPEDFRPKLPDPTFETYQRGAQYVKDNEPSEIVVRLVGKSPLWGHLLWNAGLVTTDYIDEHREKYITGKTVLELGAAAALPALNAALSARNVVITDYPDLDLLENIQYNVDALKKTTPKDLSVSTVGYIWGNEVSEVLNAPNQNGEQFDFIIMSDLIFNHSEHEKLINCCKELLADDGTIFVVFTHHRPKLAHKDLHFFERAEESGVFKCQKIIEKKMSPMFEKDEGSELVRSMVHGYLITRK